MVQGFKSAQNKVIQGVNHENTTCFSLLFSDGSGLKFQALSDCCDVSWFVFSEDTFERIMNKTITRIEQTQEQASFDGLGITITGDFCLDDYNFADVYTIYFADGESFVFYRCSSSNGYYHGCMDATAF